MTTQEQLEQLERVTDELAKHLAGHGLPTSCSTALRIKDHLAAIREAMGKGRWKLGMYQEFQAMAQGKTDYILPAFPVVTEKYGTLLCIGASEEAVYVTKQQAMAFFGLAEETTTTPADSAQSLDGIVVRLCAPTTSEPFRQMECEVVDVGHSDRVLVVECKELAKEPADSAQVLVEALKARADAEYVMAMKIANQPEAKGWVAKVKSGKFGQAEMQAHIQMNKCFGAHESIYAALAAHKSETKA